jgi:hypothetical protein
MNVEYLKKKYKKYIKVKEFDEKLDRIVKQFIKDKNLILYGGLAMHILIVNKSNGKDKIYDENDMVDYDVFSYNYVEDAEFFAKMLNSEYGYKKIRIVTGIAKKTRRVFVSLEKDARLDISKINMGELKKLKTVDVSGFLIADPHFLKIDQYQNLSINIFSDMFRMEKSLNRIILMEKYFPIERSTNSMENIEIYKRKEKDLIDIGESLSTINKNHTIVLGGDYVYMLYYGKNVSESEHEIIIYSNTLIPGKVLGVIGNLYLPNYRILPLYGEFFYNKHKNYKIVTKMTLLYQYYYLRYHENTKRYDTKIHRLVNDDETWKIYIDGEKFPDILVHSDEKVTEKKIPIKTSFID